MEAERKARKRRKDLVKMSRLDPSSKACSRCGLSGTTRSSLTASTTLCLHCVYGLMIDRDLSGLKVVTYIMKNECDKSRAGVVRNRFTKMRLWSCVGFTCAGRCWWFNRWSF
ncbi:zinc ribbon domain-containing protein [Tardisphaera saccharovorans]